MRSLKAEAREVMEVRLADLHTENGTVLLLQLAAGVSQLSPYVGSLNSLWFHLDQLNILGILEIWLVCILASLYL